MPTRKCNQGIRRKTIAKVLGEEEWKILFVIDSEGDVNNAVNSILIHFKEKYRSRIKVAIVDPRHEKWLCIGIGGGRSRCINDPEDEVSRILSRKYNKFFLSTYSRRVNIHNLINENDFKDYIEKIKWLLEDP